MPKSKVRYRSLAKIGFPNFKVGDDGSLWTNYINRSRRVSKEWRRVRGCVDKYDGYIRVKLKNDIVKRRSPGVMKSFLLHRLVLEAFVGPCPTGMEARHFPSRCRKDDRLCNLSWATPVENQSDRVVHETHNRGERGGNSKLKLDQVLKMRRQYQSGKYTYANLAARYCVSESQVWKIINRQQWSHF